MTTRVSESPAAAPEAALRRFEARLAFETDCSDVFESLKAGAVDFVLVDARGPQAFARGHVPGAVNIPHRTMTQERMADYPRDTLFVVYCAGPHCNGANRAALRLARLGYRVKEMIGGVTGWRDEGFPLAKGAAASPPPR